MSYWSSNLQQYVRDSDSDEGTYGASSKIVTPRRVPGMPFNIEPAPADTPQLNFDGSFVSTVFESQLGTGDIPTFIPGLNPPTGTSWVVGTTTPSSPVANSYIQKVPPVVSPKDEANIALTFLPPTCAVPTGTLGEISNVEPPQFPGSPFGDNEPCYTIDCGASAGEYKDYYFTLPIWVPQATMPIILWFIGGPSGDVGPVPTVTNLTSDTTLVSQSNNITNRGFVNYITRTTLNMTFTQTPGTKLEFKIKIRSAWNDGNFGYFVGFQAPFYTQRAFHLKSFTAPFTDIDGFLNCSTLNSTKGYEVVDFSVANNDGWFSNVIGKGNFYLSGGGEVNGPRSTTQWCGCVHRNYAVSYGVNRNSGDVYLAGVNLVTKAE